MWRRSGERLKTRTTAFLKTREKRRSSRLGFDVGDGGAGGEEEVEEERKRQRRT